MFKTVASFHKFELRQFGLVGYLRTLDHTATQLITTFPLASHHPSVQRMAAERFANLCRAAGKDYVEDTDELLGIEVRIAYRKDKRSQGGYHLVSIEPLVKTVVQYRDRPVKPSWLQQAKAWFERRRKGPENFGEDWGYDDY